MEESSLFYLKKDSELNGRYIIEDVLGVGGFGITYMAKDVLLDNKVAIKEFFPQGIVVRNHEVSNLVSVSYMKQDDIFQNGKEHFISEARIMARFQRNNGIVRVMDFFETNNTAYIVMEYLDGITLKEYLISNGTISQEDILELLTPLLEALDEIHKAGLIHRDISPDNIMILPGGAVKLMDFGAARDYTEFGGKSLSVVLKHGYAPPEQYQSRGIQGPWTDIYALSATIYRCITGEVPQDSIERVMDDRLRRPSELGVPISPQVENTLMRGMNVTSKYRYQNLGDFCNDLYGDSRNIEIYPGPYETPDSGASSSGSSGHGNTGYGNTGQGNESGSKLKKFLLPGLIVLAFVVLLAVDAFLLKYHSEKKRAGNEAATVSEQTSENQDTSSEETEIQETTTEAAESTTASEEKTEEEKESPALTAAKQNSFEAETTPEEFKGHAYAVFNYKELNINTFNGCEQYCRSLGGHLAVINSEKENTFIYNYLQKNGLVLAFFGYTDEGHEGTWRWVDGSSSGYTNWCKIPGKEQPNNPGKGENYGQFFKDTADGTWNNSKFGVNTHRFICEWE